MKFTAAIVAFLSVAAVSAAPTQVPDTNATSGAMESNPCSTGRVGLCCSEWTSSQEAVGVCASPSTAENQDVFRSTCQGQGETDKFRAYCCVGPASLTARGYSATGCWRV